LKITAIENSDYTLDVIKGNNIDTDKTIKYYATQAGRPKKFFLSKQETHCFNGTISDTHREFVLTVTDNKLKGTEQSDKKAASNVAENLEVKATLNDLTQEMLI
jgi:hypothetical protein